MGRGGEYKVYDVRCHCGATGRMSTMGRHRYDRKPRRTLPEGWHYWGNHYFCGDCYPHRALVQGLWAARCKLQEANSGWEFKLCGNGFNLALGKDVLIRVETKPPAVYVLSQPFDGDVGAAMDSEQVKVWLAENAQVKIRDPETSTSDEADEAH